MHIVNIFALIQQIYILLLVEIVRFCFKFKFCHSLTSFSIFLIIKISSLWSGVSESDGIREGPWRSFFPNFLSWKSTYTQAKSWAKTGCLPSVCRQNTFSDTWQIVCKDWRTTLRRFQFLNFVNSHICSTICFKLSTIYLHFLRHILKWTYTKGKE